MPISSGEYKRHRSLLQSKNEPVIDISDKWKRKLHEFEGAAGTLSKVNTYERQVVPASNVKREAEDGCMKKIKLERSLKLHREDARGRETNLITNNLEGRNVWLDCFEG